MFVFDRANGTPLFPIEYRKFPASDVPGEVAAETQPLPTKPEPFARQLLTEDMLTTRTPEAHSGRSSEFATFRNDGPFVPFARRAADRRSSRDSTAARNGAARRSIPTPGSLYVNANDIAWTGALAPDDGRPERAGALPAAMRVVPSRRPAGHAAGRFPTLVGIGARKLARRAPAIIRKGAGRMPGFPTLQPGRGGRDRRSTWSTRRRTRRPTRAAIAAAYRRSTASPATDKFLDPDGYPAVAPPWGTLSAINLNTGEYAWKIPLGEYPELVAKGLKNTGSENYGGPIVTAGGLVFIGATNYDRKFRAFDKATGQLLWETTLPFSGNATPATYEVNGRQFVVIAAGGGKGRPRSLRRRVRRVRAALPPQLARRQVTTLRLYGRLRGQRPFRDDREIAAERVLAVQIDRARELRFEGPPVEAGSDATRFA